MNYLHEIIVRHGVTNRVYAKLWMLKHGRSNHPPKDLKELYDAAYSILWDNGAAWTDIFADRFFIDDEESEDKEIYDTILKSVDELVEKYAHS